MKTLTSAQVTVAAQLNQSFSKLVPYNVALGLSFEELAEATARMRLPYSDKLVGNPVSGVLHGGAVTTLMDTCCGAAVFMALAEPTMIATLDLRIDYLEPSEPKRDLIAAATCYKVTRNIAFVRAFAFHEGQEDEPIAAAAGSFIITPGRLASKTAEPP